MIHATNLRFVITGGPGAGKTTLLETLEKRGYSYVPESARAIIKERLAQGLSPRPSPDRFGRDILDRDIARYRSTSLTEQPVFFDRGVVDALYVLDRHKALSTEEITRHVTLFPYNQTVFFLPPWEEIYCTDAERDQTFSESIEVFEGLKVLYRRCGYCVMEVPRLSAELRAAFILDVVQRAGSDAARHAAHDRQHDAGDIARTHGGGEEDVGG